MAGMMSMGLASHISSMSELSLSDPKSKQMSDNNRDIVKRLVELKSKREQVDKEIVSEEDELGKLKEALSMTARRIEEINASVNDKADMLQQYEGLAQDAEASYSKIVETSSRLIESLEMAIKASLSRKDPSMMAYAPN